MKFEAEAKRAKIEAEKEKESARMKIEAEAQKESERMKLEAEKESERMKFEAEQRRQEFELRKLEMERDLRLREVHVNVEQNGGGEGGVPSDKMVSIINHSQFCVETTAFYERNVLVIICNKNSF